jgi:hypothetical protein
VHLLPTESLERGASKYWNITAVYCLVFWKHM